MLAGHIARQTGREAVEIARSIALATTGFAIVVTLLMAGLAHQAVSLIMGGLGVPVQIVVKTSRPDGGQAAPDRKKARAAAAKARAPKMPNTGRPVRVKQRIAAFAREAFRVDVELTGAIATAATCVAGAMALAVPSLSGSSAPPAQCERARR